jgi:hypothetical protein
VVCEETAAAIGKQLVAADVLNSAAARGASRGRSIDDTAKFEQKVVFKIIDCS